MARIVIEGDNDIRWLHSESKISTMKDLTKDDSNGLIRMQDLGKF